MKRVCKKIISFILCFGFGVSAIPTSVYAADSESITFGETGGYLSGNAISIENIYTESRKFSGPTGHGFAAERANNLSDRFRGTNAIVVGDDNVKNGADRKIMNKNGSTTWIQDKYYNSASKSVSSAFDSETGMYRYIDPEGKPMQLEVPADQYEDAITCMEAQIEAGNVESVTDPAEARNIIRKGSYTFEQAKNIVKAGNIESLKYDAANGFISASCAVGISFVLDFVSCRINGDDMSTAINSACKNGLKTGGFVFGTYVISSQLAKTNLAKTALSPVTEKIASSLGKEFSTTLLETYGIKVSSQNITSRVATLLSTKIIANGVVVVALSAGDVVDLLQGRISEEQLLKNLVVTVASVGGAEAGALAGGAIGSAVAPGAGTVIGGIAGGVVGSLGATYITEAIISQYYEDDAEKMYKIISEEFTNKCNDYLVSQAECDNILASLSELLTGDTLKDMYESDDRNQFARDLMDTIFESEVAKRDTITVPTNDEIRYQYKEMLSGIVFVH